jgi:type VI secretion system protein ImpK
MSNGNPFEGDAERTVIRPSPGGRRPGPGGPQAPQPQANPFGDMPPPRAPAASPPPAAGSEERTQIAMPRPRGGAAPTMQAPAQRPTASAAPPGNLLSGGLNPLVSAATPILALAARVRTMPQCADIEALRERVVAEIRMFERRVGGSGMPPETLRGAHYAVCATIDDCINNTPWGAGSAWARQSMTGVFHNDVAGGERFFELLRHFHQNPGRYGDVLELMYLCLSLGMEGQYRLAPRGSSELLKIRDGLHRMLRERRGEAERELSPRWKGVDARTGRSPRTSPAGWSASPRRRSSPSPMSASATPSTPPPMPSTRSSACCRRPARSRSRSRRRRRRRRRATARWHGLRSSSSPRSGKVW